VKEKRGAESEAGDGCKVDKEGNFV